MPRPRLPLLTLFTGGKECSLCEVAKVELAHVRRTHPFELRLWNIRDPPAEVDEREAKKWRRLYQYDIPVLHIEDKRIQKHRIDRPALQAALEAWYAQKQQSEEASSKEDPKTAQTSENEAGSDGEGGSESRSKVAPWRARAGMAWLGLDSGVFHEVERQSASAPEVFAEIVSGMFAGFASSGDMPDGRAAVLSSLDNHQPHTIYAAEIDSEPHSAPVDHDIIYTRPLASQVSTGTPSRGTTKGTRADQLCWNCREPGHTAAECPAPRNHLMTRASRERFMFERDFIMPDHARSYLLNYQFDENERRRRLALIDRYHPGGQISADLADALFWLNDDGADDEHDDDGIVFVSGGRGGTGVFQVPAEVEEGEVDEDAQARQEEKDRLAVMKSRGQWPWLMGMLRWGYPPGWVAAKDPIEVIRRRVSHLPFTHALDMDDDESEDELEIFGGDTMSSPPKGRSDPTPGPPPSPPMSPPSTPPPPPATGPDEPPEPPSSPPPSPPAALNLPRVSTQPGSWAPYRPIKPLPQRPVPKSHARKREVNPYLVGVDIPQRRWAHYPSDMYDSARLQVYSDARPVPLGF